MFTPRFTGWPAAAATGFCALLSACGGGSGGGGIANGGSCSAAREKDFVEEVAREWYLFRETLPASINPNDHPTASDLLDALTATARTQGRDRFFSYVTTRQADSSFLQEGEFIGFGFRTMIDGNQLRIPDVYENSPAEEGGLVRGAEITAIDSGSGFVPMATILQTDPNLEQVFGAATAGVQRGLQFTLPGGATDQAVFTKRLVTIQPVPGGGTAILALPSNPAVPVGYVNLRTFISTAQTPLRNAYAQFRAQGIQYLIVDLRYNGGGLVGIADLLGDLNGFGRAQNDVFERMRFHASKSVNDSEHRFIPQAQSIAPVRIAFITTGASASASELVINSMKPWTEVAIVGTDTFGKPVGQSAFDLSGCDLRLRLITFRITNADDEGDYYDGLAETLPFACAADDDLASAPGTPAEASTEAALNWLGTGACDDVIVAAPGGPLQMARAPPRLPRMRQPSAAQVWMPGLY